MALEISREASFSAKSRAFRFKNRRDVIADRRLFEIGQKCESARFRKGSVGQKVFDLMSSRRLEFSQPKRNK